MSSITGSSRWKALRSHCVDLQESRISDLFAKDEHRFERFSITSGDILFDYSKNLISETTSDLLCELANEAQLAERIDDLFSGKKVNSSEARPALHTLLRSFSGEAFELDGVDISAEIAESLLQMRSLSDEIRAGERKGVQGKPIRNIVHLGVGGSDLGPRMVLNALIREPAVDIRVEFVAGMDGNEITTLLPQLNPHETIIIVASKSFGTADTLANLATAHNWLQQDIGSEVGEQLIGISANRIEMGRWGIPEENQFPMWDWVGGRYSVWSAIGLPIAIKYGMDCFESFLQGAHDADCHFRNAELPKNIPVIQALLSIWYNNFFDAETQAILPYDHRLQLLPAYLQQLEMESNGKGADLQGKSVTIDSSPIIWGEFGPNAQHAFFQLLHQGTRFVPTEFIAVANNNEVQASQHRLTLANCLAQSQAFMTGQPVATNTKDQTKHYPGNKPSSTFVFSELNARNLGTLIAFYEHKVFVQSVIWGINPFDQWGVELGKKLASEVLAQLSTPKSSEESRFDGSTLGILNYIKSCTK